MEVGVCLHGNDLCIAVLTFDMKGEEAEKSSQSHGGKPFSTGQLLFKDKKQTALIFVVVSRHAHVKHKHMLQTTLEIFEYWNDFATHLPSWRAWRMLLC